MRTAAERRHHRERVIAKRRYIVANAWSGGIAGSIYEQQPGRLAKHNLNCGCWMCQLNQTKRPVPSFDWRREVMP